MISTIGFQSLPNVSGLSMVNKSYCYRNAVFSENCIKLGIAAAHSKLVYFEAGLCRLTFSKLLQKCRQVQKLYEENTDEKSVKMTKRSIIDFLKAPRAFH